MSWYTTVMEQGGKKSIRTHKRPIKLYSSFHDSRVKTNTIPTPRYDCSLLEFARSRLEQKLSMYLYGVWCISIYFDTLINLRNDFISETMLTGRCIHVFLYQLILVLLFSTFSFKHIQNDKGGLILEGYPRPRF